MDQVIVQPSSGLRSKSEAAVWSLLLVLWGVALCLVPHPRPLSAPEWLVSTVRSATGFSEPSARLAAAVSFRSLGLFILGCLVSLSLSSTRIFLAAPMSVIISSSLAITTMWCSYGYFPVSMQIQLGVVSVMVGVLAGFVLLRNKLAVGAFVFFGLVFSAWGASIGVSDELDVAARSIGKKLLDKSDSFPDGDEGFVATLRDAFTIAHENSSSEDVVFANKAAILALGVILGEDRVARVAKREVDPAYQEKKEQLRSRITLRGRNDLSRHFWVSAALVVISNESNSRTVGIAKEMMDSGSGGSGFSFADLAADFAGIQFAAVAIKREQSAIEIRKRVQQADSSHDFCPAIDGLPEGLSAEKFQKEFGGLGGKETRALFNEIHDRIRACPALMISE